MTTERKSKSEPAKRPTLAEIMKMQLAAFARSGEHSTVKLVRNARGDTQIEVSIRTDEDGIADVDAACVKAQEIYDGLANKYAISDPAAAAAGARVPQRAFVPRKAPVTK